MCVNVVNDLKVWYNDEETDLWRERNFVTGAELYDDGPLFLEYLCHAPTALSQLTNNVCACVCECVQWRPC